jgi:antitoxin component of MazEF toxin-antitoxin module
MSRRERPFTLKRKVREIGGSLNTSIPREIVFKLKLLKGDMIEFYEANGDVCVRKAKPTR